jgi:sigma-B regulation protein RsbU (phosphoserine phosphatase)
MALTCTLLRAEAVRDCEPVDVLACVNEQLRTRKMKSMFVTLIYMDVDLATRDVNYVRAGHDFPLLWDRGGRALPAPEGRSQPLGLFDRPVLDAQRLRLPAQMTLLAYTDGVTEAMDGDGRLFGRDRLLERAVAANDLSAHDLCLQVVRTVTGYQPRGEQMDDITVLALRVD